MDSNEDNDVKDRQEDGCALTAPDKKSHPAFADGIRRVHSSVYSWFFRPYMID
jgi:hypothetical protein